MMSTTDSRTRIPRTLALIALGVVVAAGVGLYAAWSRGPEPADGVATPAADATETAVRRPAALKPRRGRSLSVADASRALDLIRPTREKYAEDFTLPLADGSQFRLANQRGKVIMINFWATWCGPCREEMPAMERLWRHQKDQGFVLVAVSLDANTDAVAPYVKQLGLTFPVALDPKMDAGNVYGVRALPSSFIVDRRGKVVALALGPRHWDGDAGQSLIEGYLR